MPKDSMYEPCQSCKHAGPGHPRWSDHCKSCVHPNVRHFNEGRIIFELDVEQRGIDNGWFNWPFNFDPAWLNSCKGYEPQGGY